MSPIEIVATVFGLACVGLTVKEKIWCWPIGLVQVILYVYVFYTAKLYSDSILQVIYIPLQFYGWYYWLKGGNRRTEAPVTVLSIKELSIWTILGFIGMGAWGWFMKTHTDAACPYPDAFIVSMSLIAQWLMSKKKLESWGFWLVVDVVAVGVYLYKHLYFTSGLYAVYIGLAIMGLLSWFKSYTGQKIIKC